jgi:hypothetical protein
MKFSAVLGLALLGVLLVILALWGALALFYSGPGGDVARLVLAAAFGVVSVVTLVALGLRRWRWRALGVHLLLFAAIVLWLQSKGPSNSRDWQTDVAVLPYATIEGDSVTVHNIRNFDYRSETDFTPAYYDKRFDLRKLEGVDVVSVYWMGPAIAHIFLSFRFGDDDHLAVSIEARKVKGEGYSSLKGFFRQYELIYVVADERDVIRLRTNYRKDPPEDVYIYPMRGSNERARRVFLEYLRRINALKEQPEFYNTLTTNCTTTIWMAAGVNEGRVPFSWKILASGYLPEYLYESGRLETYGLSFPDLQRRVYANPRAHAADQAPDFSRRIREPTETRAEQ